MHTILPHQVLIAFAVTLLAGLATVIGGALGYFILAPFMSFSVYQMERKTLSFRAEI